MNLLLLHEDDLISDTRARIMDRRFSHMVNVQRVSVGDQLRSGMLNGQLGTAEVISVSSDHILVEIVHSRAAPKPLPLTLILALPRPKMLKRILQTAATLGVKELILINAYRVEKSFWSTPILKQESIDEHFRLGLEQAGDTWMPKLSIKKRFKPFVEDELPALAKDKRALIAHPYDAHPCPEAEMCETVLVIGPEGGFLPYEVNLMQQQGLTAIHLGSRILRVETAVPALLSRLFPLI